INAVCSCIDEKCTVIHQKSLESMIVSLPKEEKEHCMAQFMEKFLKAASMNQDESNEEKENFLIYVFGIAKEDIPDRLNRLENHTQCLVESRNAFIQAAIAWSRKPDEKNEITLIRAAENQKELDSASEEPAYAEHSDFIEEIGEIEEQEDNESISNENSDIADETIETVDDGAFESDSYSEFYQIMDGRLDSLKNAAEQLEEKPQPSMSNKEAEVSKKSAQEEKKKPEISQESSEIKSSETAVKQEPQAASGREDKIKKKQEVSGKKESEYSRILQKRIHMLRGDKEAQPSDDSETNSMCWKLLQEGEFVLAREAAAVFRETSPGNCVNPTVIDVIGSGLYMPVTEEDTQQYFLSRQPLLQFDQLDSFEQMAVALAAFPIAHCCYEVRFDTAMLDVLPGAFHKWACELARLRAEITYIDRTAVESYRVYRVRMKKIDQIQKRAKQQFEAMLNSKIQYEGANKILTAVCSKDQCVGVLWDLMNETDSEQLAAGVGNPKVEELYRKGRVYISDKKNTLKAIDEGFVSRVVEDAQKKCGYKTAIVGNPKNKMMQMVRDFLMTANEWLELIGSPCSYNRNMPSSAFIQKLSASYQKRRTKLYEDARGMTSETYLPDIVQNMLASMDYLMGMQENMPQDCKSYLEHIYRLCAKPNLYIKKDESEIYRCECQNPIEHLQFLNEVICSNPCAVDECLKKFIEADAFSGCAVIFDMAEQICPEETAKIRQNYEQSVRKRLDELRDETARMKIDLYQLSVYAGWFGNDYLSLTSKITMIDQMMKDEPRDLTMLCTFVKECRSGVKNLVEEFRNILRKQVRGNFNEERSNKLYALIEEGQYAAVIEWTSHINITDAGVEESDFFKERYFNEEIYSRKEKSLLQRIKIKDLVERLRTAITRTNSWEGFDFNRVPGRIGNLRGQLIQMWYQIKSELIGITRSSVEKNRAIFNELEQMLKMLGWDVIELKECSFCEDESGGYLQFDMYFRPTHSRERCPVPLFGSGSDGRIRMICLYGNTNAPDKQYDLFENKNQQIPMIILFFGVMTHTRRMELQGMALDKQSSFLLVDDIVITTICERRETMLLRWLYALTVPFSVQKLYTAALGVVHPEMFYGRISAKAELGLNGAVCAVYGGRQLGKTALLKNIESESHNPK
ncbi:MAG: hypothetical protein NC124_20665, partial [Clostridium sp.]|nr:hypothetical protein [Clostridium sp.]